MTTRKKANPPAGNPVEDGLLDWMDSPAGEQSMEVMDTVFALLDEVAVDARRASSSGRMASGYLSTSPCSAFTPSIRNFPSSGLKTA